jgi:hypothetical protein
MACSPKEYPVPVRTCTDTPHSTCGGNKRKGPRLRTCSRVSLISSVKSPGIMRSRSSCEGGGKTARGMLQRVLRCLAWRGLVASFNLAAANVYVRTSEYLPVRAYTRLCRHIKSQVRSVHFTLFDIPGQQTSLHGSRERENEQKTHNSSARSTWQRFSPAPPFPSLPHSRGSEQACMIAVLHAYIPTSERWGTRGYY